MLWNPHARTGLHLYVSPGQGEVAQGCIHAKILPAALDCSASPLCCCSSVDAASVQDIIFCVFILSTLRLKQRPKRHIMPSLHKLITRSNETSSLHYVKIVAKAHS